MNVPDGWRATELGKLLVERKKSGLKVSDAANFGQYPFFTSGEAVLQHTAKQVEGDNIYLATGGVANIKYFSGEAAYSTDTYTVSTSKEVETEYLYFNLLDILDYINANYFQGSGLKHLQKKDFKKHPILYPEQPAEQRQIACILSKVDEAISQTEQLIAKYRRLKTGLMQDLLTKGIDEHGNIRSEETHAFKDSLLGRIPVEWEIGKLGELVSAVDPQPDHRTPPAQIDGVPFIGISDFLPNGEIDTESCRKVGIAALEKQQRLFKIKKGDIIFGKRGTIGEPIILPDYEKHRFVLSFNVILIKPHECPDFVFWSLKSKYVDEQIKIFINLTSQPSFGMQEIRSLDIMTPKADERGRITEKLNKAEKILVAESENLIKYKSLKTGLMQDLLSGKVRVGQLIPETVEAC